MQAVILAAGIGKRMRPLTLERPKPLIEVAGKLLIEHVLDALPSEIDEIILVVGYKGEMIRQHLGEAYHGIPLRYVYQWMPAGTAHSLSIARPFIKGTFLMLNADDIIGTDALAQAIKEPLAILVARHDHPEKMGVVSVKTDGTLDSIVEKPEHPVGNLINTNSLVLDERIFGYEAPRHESGEYYVTDLLNAMAKDLPVKVIEQPLWIPVGCPEDIPAAEEELKKHNLPE